eukprot:CAMPEP_0119013440 /NCGR_PEP_ID=MMETSP1176-20130426/8452_1 /TAXON_ID=265551 /ORGANISM="Synedropsis recta cf, Strain CCMP1620" /LENGTH=320 /DNA_ID=CAMNT_0006966531 /DNA_START=146 /DNA_END=1105 /DNA_ORIENTATION=-
MTKVFFLTQIVGILLARASFGAAQFPFALTPTCNVGENALWYLPASRTCMAEVDDEERCWYTYAPDGSQHTSSEDRVPLVIDLHGYKGCAQWSPLYTGWKDLATEHGFVVAWPQGHIENNVLFSHTCWDAGPDCCCHRWKHEIRDDVAFLSSMIAEIVEDNPRVDSNRVYLAGHSNGCMMAQRLAAETTGLVAAVACHSGALVGDFSEYFTNNGNVYSNSPTPIMTIWGDADDVLPFEGGGTDGLRGATENMEVWSSMNGCSERAATSVVVDESNLFETLEWDGCNQSMVTVYDVGHFPYKDAGMLLQKGTSVDTTAMAW